MPTIVYGTINPDTGETVSTRSVESPYNVPKLDTIYKEANPSWSEQIIRAAIPIPYTATEKERAAETGGIGMEQPKQWAESAGSAVASTIGQPLSNLGKGLSGAISNLTLIAIAVAAIVLVPRFVPAK